MKKFIILGIVCLFGCNNSPVENSPGSAENAVNLTPQCDDYSEADAQITNSGHALWYFVNNDEAESALFEQEIGNNERVLWMIIFCPSVEDHIRSLKLSPDGTFLLAVAPNFEIFKWIIFAPGNPLIDMTYNPAIEPRISPDSTHIAYQTNHEGEPENNVYIMTPMGEKEGAYYRITHSELAPQGFQYEFLPVCWLSDSELVVRRKRNLVANDYNPKAYDMMKYDINDLSASPVLLSTVEGDVNQPMGYSELINQSEGWYIDSFGDAKIGYSNLYKCPLGVTGDYGEQLTFGGNWDIPTDLTSDGNSVIFVRRYQLGSHFLTGASDIYMMDLN